ncbi:MAG TPA: Asp-tRNA(Asn)/Glu-tRNA(Gln) amidotransferase subunit GatC [Terriglobales bacterium]|nr:Asp-tRNA(Asn)/Glu-tRNA(Gln) amidotransferase subunit GatC [Terriglobales bacterium]
MKVTKQDVDYVAALANLELTPEERQRMLRDLNSILDYVDRLNQLDTTGVAPMAQVMQGFETSEQQGQCSSVMRNDELYGLRPSLPHEEALTNAPESDGTFFLVPKVIER